MLGRPATEYWLIGREWTALCIEWLHWALSGCTVCKRRALGDDGSSQFLGKVHVMWLAKIFDSITPFVFAVMAAVLAFLLVEGISKDAVAFGTGRTLVYISRAVSPALYYCVMLAFPLVRSFPVRLQ